MSRVVLVTGVARYLGGRLAAMLADDPAVDRVVGVDLVDPPHDIGNAEFVRTDIRRPQLSSVLYDVAPDTVVHMNVLFTQLDAGGRVPQKEINVIGTMQLLGACQNSPYVKSLVVKSSAAVYGATPRDPAHFTEDLAPKAVPMRGFAKDSIEVEGYVRGFARRRPDVAVSTLRFANFIGPRVRTSLTSYFMLPVVPTILGFDPRLQFVHEDDGLEAIRHAVHEQRAGTFNVAGDGTLSLSQAIRRTGRPQLPVPRFATGPMGQVLRRARLVDFSPEQLGLLTYGRGLDTTRMRQVFGFHPKHTTAHAFADFVDGQAGVGILHPEDIAAAERTVVAAMLRRDVGDGDG